MSAASRLAGIVLIEPALPTPFAIVTARAAGTETARFFNTVDEARVFACQLADERGALLVDLVAAEEGGEQ